MKQKSKTAECIVYILINALLYVIDELLFYNMSIVGDIILTAIILLIGYRATLSWNIFYYKILKFEKAFRKPKVCLFYSGSTWFISTLFDGGICTYIVNTIFKSVPNAQNAATWIIYYFAMLLFEAFRGLIFFIISRNLNMKYEEKKHNSKN